MKRRSSIMGDARVRVVTTGFGYLLVCALCGVLLWDVNAHYRFAHPEVTR